MSFDFKVGRLLIRSDEGRLLYPRTRITKKLEGRPKPSRFAISGPLFFDRRAAGIERDRNLIGRSAPMLDEEEFHNRTGGKFFVL